MVRFEIFIRLSPLGTTLVQQEAGRHPFQSLASYGESNIYLIVFQRTCVEDIDRVSEGRSLTPALRRQRSQVRILSGAPIFQITAPMRTSSLGRFMASVRWRMGGLGCLPLPFGLGQSPADYGREACRQRVERKTNLRRLAMALGRQQPDLLTRLNRSRKTAQETNIPGRNNIRADADAQPSLQAGVNGAETIVADGNCSGWDYPLQPLGQRSWEQSLDNRHDGMVFEIFDGSRHAMADCVVLAAAETPGVVCNNQATKQSRKLRRIPRPQGQIGVAGFQVHKAVAGQQLDFDVGMLSTELS